MKFTVLYTNDIHSRFKNIAKVSRKINEVRYKNTLLLDLGDFNNFMRMENIMTFIICLSILYRGICEIRIELTKNKNKITYVY